VKVSVLTKFTKVSVTEEEKPKPSEARRKVKEGNVFTQSKPVSRAGRAPGLGREFEDPVKKSRPTSQPTT
jgi:hypothetical protein